MAASNQSKIPAGTVIEGKFRVTREIGRGGMAAVYEAENVDIGKRVAVKILAAELITSRVVRERFIREARAAASMRSPYICDVYDSGMYDERPFLVMELLEGESLYDMMTRVRRLDVRTTLTIATHVARGLQRAHESNIVHRDLKPENIFLTLDEEGSQLAKILDFGLAKFYEPTEGDAKTARLTREGALFGTPAYMSPEQAKGQGAVDHRADLWALGCIVYECLTGHTVWNVDQGVAMILAQIASAPLPQPSKLRSDLPPAFDAWFARALNRTASERFQTAREFADTLAATLAATRIPTPNRRLLDPAALGVDELLSAPIHAEERPAPAAHPSPVPQAPVATASAGPQKSSSGALMSLFVVAALALAGYAVWLYVIHPTGNAADFGSDDSLVPARDRKPLEHEPFALQIAAAQDWLARGHREKAMELFQEAFKNGGHPVARSLLSQASIGLVQKDAKCRVNGIGRPRPFPMVEPTSRPTLAWTETGVVVAWVDNHQDKTRRQAFSVLLDESLRRVTQPKLITPESQAVRHPQLQSAGDRLAFIYWDSAGDRPGVYVRLLKADGAIAGPARLISRSRKHQFFPALAPRESDTFWAVWEQELDDGTTDLMALPLNANLEPEREAVRLTAFADSPVAGSANRPDVAVAHGHLNIIFSHEQGPKNQRIMLLRVRLDDKDLESGLPSTKQPRPKAAAPGSEDARAQAAAGGTRHHVGVLSPVSAEQGKNAQARITCNDAGCFAVWDDETAGAFAAFIDRESGQTIWHREFASKGSRPTLGMAEDGSTAIAWFEGGRVRMAKVTRDGLDRPSVLGRVSGFQPYPALTAGPGEGQWYVTFRDYEAGHLEAFVLRAECS